MTDCIRTQLANAYRNHHRKLYFCAYKITNDAEEARNCVASAYAKALERDQFTGNSAMFTYLWSVTKNNALDHVRSHKVKYRSSAAPADVESRWVPADIVPRPFPGPLQALLTKERIALTRAALASMKPAKRRALVLHAFEGMKYKDIATTTGAKIGTVMSRINHARAEVKASV